MILKTILLLPSLLSFTLLFSQKNISKNASQLQLEALGPGSLFSLKFDTRISKKENGIGLNVGIGSAALGMLGKSCNTGFQLALPVGVNYLIGKNKHLLELGVGFVPTITSGTKVFCQPIAGGKPDFFSDDMSSYSYLLAGYRYQPVHKKGLTYRLFLSPLLQKDFPVKFWGGGSVGIRF